MPTKNPLIKSMNDAIRALKGKQERVAVNITDPTCPHLSLVATGKVNPAERGHVLWQCSCGSLFSLPVSVAEIGFRNAWQRNISKTLDKEG